MFPVSDMPRLPGFSYLTQFSDSPFEGEWPGLSSTRMAGLACASPFHDHQGWETGNVSFLAVAPHRIKPATYEADSYSQRLVWTKSTSRYAQFIRCVPPL